MQLVKTTVKVLMIGLIAACSQPLLAQENSPYSRYGLGDLFPNQHVATRAMGGISATWRDLVAVNTSNPASYANLQRISYDLALTIDSRTLQDNVNPRNYRSTNFMPAYVTIGFPISTKRNLGMVFGVRPVTRINYNVESNSRLSGIDSIKSIYEGNGGLNQVFIGLGKRWKGLSVGANVGYLFGKKETSTKILLINDTVTYYPGMRTSNVTFNNPFANIGIQYEMVLKNRYDTSAKRNITHQTYIRFGATGSIKQDVRASEDVTENTFTYNASGGISAIDSVRRRTNIRGTITLPTTYTVGVAVGRRLGGFSNAPDQFLVSAEYTNTRWSQYRYYGQRDKVQDNWTARFGIQFTPNPFDNRFVRTTTYRLGFYTGQDYLIPENRAINISALTVGGTFNIRKFRMYDNQFTQVSTALELGRRGGTNNSISENFIRLSVGFSLTDIWGKPLKRKYD
jgi:hypothetical protein